MMLRELADHFNKSGEIYLKANREGPMTLAIRMQSDYEPDKEAKTLMSWTRRANYVWLAGTGAVAFLRGIREYISNEYGMRFYIDLTLEILGLTQGKERQSKLAQLRHRTKSLAQKRYGNVNWRKAILESKVARKVISEIVAASLLKTEDLSNGCGRQKT